MKLKITIYIFFVALSLGLIGKIFWEQEYKFIQPTPKPIDLKEVKQGDIVRVPLLNTQHRSTYFHFYNYDCPCSRFNIKEFQSLTKKYKSNIHFIAVLQAKNADEDAIRQFKKRHDLGIEVIEDPNGEIAAALGVYSTPQAVILRGNEVYYKGNYNKARFCLSKNTKFAEMALKAFVNNEAAPEFPAVAEIAYGCELPSNNNESNNFLGIF